MDRDDRAGHTFGVAVRQARALAILPIAWGTVAGTVGAHGASTAHSNLLTRAIRCPDLQRNTRVGATLSIPIVGQQSIKFAYSTGTTTRRGSDFNPFNATVATGDVLNRPDPWPPFSSV